MGHITTPWRERNDGVLMAKNEAYLKSSSDKGSDECLTPEYAVIPIVKHLRLKGYKRILCPFDKADSQFVRVLMREGFIVQFSHIESGQDFFKMDYNQARQYDAIVSNPPFSMKDQVLKTLYAIGIPFAVILPQNALQSQGRVNLYIKHGIEYLGFDKRIQYYTKGELDAWKPDNHFASAYFCHGVLPEKMIFETLEPVQKGYHE